MAMEVLQRKLPADAANEPMPKESTMVSDIGKSILNAGVSVNLNVNTAVAASKLKDINIGMFVPKFGKKG
jgi:hypothetical protein